MEVNIYKLSCNITNQCYYGSTTKILDYRLQEHKNDYNSFLNNKKNYITSFEIIKNNDYKIELMENCNEDERDIRESYYIKNFECINKVIPNRDK